MLSKMWRKNIWIAVIVAMMCIPCAVSVADEDVFEVDADFTLTFQDGASSPEGDNTVRGNNPQPIPPSSERVDDDTLVPLPPPPLVFGGGASSPEGNNMVRGNNQTSSSRAQRDSGNGGGYDPTGAATVIRKLLGGERW